MFYLYLYLNYKNTKCFVGYNKIIDHPMEQNFGQHDNKQIDVN